MKGFEDYDDAEKAAQREAERAMWRRAAEIEVKLLDRSEEIFKEAWHKADAAGMVGNRVRTGLKALIDAGLLIDLSAFPMRSIRGFGETDVRVVGEERP